MEATQPQSEHSPSEPESAPTNLMAGFEAARRVHDDSAPIYRVISPFKEDGDE